MTQMHHVADCAPGQRAGSVLVAATVVASCVQGWLTWLIRWGDACRLRLKSVCQLVCFLNPFRFQYLQPQESRKGDGHLQTDEAVPCPWVGDPVHTKCLAGRSRPGASCPSLIPVMIPPTTVNAVVS